MDGGGAGFVVVVARIKDRQIDMLVHQFADGVLQRARDKLVLQGNREHDQLIFVEWFEFCHRSPLSDRTLIALCWIPPLFRQSQRARVTRKWASVDSV